MVREIILEQKKLIFSDEIIKIIDGEVKKIGNGGMVLANKKYIGNKAYLLIRKN